MTACSGDSFAGFRFRPNLVEPTRASLPGRSQFSTLCRLPLRPSMRVIPRPCFRPTHPVPPSPLLPPLPLCTRPRSLRYSSLEQWSPQARTAESTGWSHAKPSNAQQVFWSMCSAPRMECSETPTQRKHISSHGAVAVATVHLAATNTLQLTEARPCVVPQVARSSFKTKMQAPLGLGRDSSRAVHRHEARMRRQSPLDECPEEAAPGHRACCDC